MLSLITVLAMHVPVENYLTCDDYYWLKQGLSETELFTPVEKADILIRWIEHTDPACFDD